MLTREKLDRLAATLAAFGPCYFAAGFLPGELADLLDLAAAVLAEREYLADGRPAHWRFTSQP